MLIKNIQAVNGLLRYVTIEVSKTSVNSQTLVGKTLVVTGTLSTLSRDEIKNLIRLAGGKVASSVSRKTDYVVVGAEAGSKVAEAERLGISILSEKEFLDLVT